MYRSFTASAWTAGLIVALVAGSAIGDELVWKPILLKRVAVGISNIVPIAGGRGAIGIPFTSNSDSTVWVRLSLRAPAPAPEGSSGFALAARRDTVVRFPQDAFAADADYTIAVALFADSASADTLESGSTTGRLGKKDIKGLEAWLKAGTLPKTFKNIERVDKVTAGTTLSGIFGVPKGNGKLTVDATGVNYDAKKKSIVIPASAILDVGINDANPDQPWVVVTYELNGEKKTVSFKPNLFRGGAPASEIAAAIQSAMLQSGGK